VKARAHGGPAAGVDVRFRGRAVRTGGRGTAAFRVTLPPGRYRVRATRADLRSRSATVRAVAPAVCAAGC
jgi:hypothetical protein